ncbi:hypothetical protein SCHPADRAFT_819890 [Schizopora paradoxa]|uniref:Mei2-like C-terminal RNA recognition motif domain-containing protein n=1 Tax=Schizopora paradoxa TaxID=27342 RepID=A0A0H2SMY3_9AGAM|nr:hypothetical protein SCHPADRAFT_819890 [Schizopora paradoxa]
MIKNIPNKLSDRDLVEYIAKVCPRKIDFLYLRMDFQNGCNVGYAFVNFIRVEDLLLFARAKLGVKWNMFSSEKVLQMSYANYQGKEALVEKFKNSCVMDEREAWRPKIFFSAGPKQGLPEPFPSPTHLRRKERSSQNRGALFVPSPPSGGGGGSSGGAGYGAGGYGMYGGGGGGGGSAQVTPRQPQYPTTLGGRFRGWVLPSHESPTSSSGGMGMGHGHGHETLAPAPSLT